MSPTLRVLYAEDNALDADLTLSHFKECALDFEIELVETGQACLERLSTAGSDVLLLDHHLPDMEGLDVLRALVRSGVLLPVVLVTGAGDEELVVKALHLGASNYVAKVGPYLEGLPDLLRITIEDYHFKQSQGLLSRAQRRILYIEHLEMDIELTVRHFAEAAPHVEIEVIRNCSEALARLRQPPAYDAVLLDLRMPDQSGVEFVREAKRSGLPLPPFIVISGQGDEAAAIASLKLGAADYVAKRSGYLNQITYSVDRAIAYERLDRVNAQLQIELAERKRAEDDVRASETRYRRLFESAKDGLLILDAESGRVVDANPLLLHMLGCAHSDLLGKELWNLDPFKSVVASEDFFSVLKGKEYVRYEDVPLKIHDGRDGKGDRIVSADFISNAYLVGDTQVIQCNIRDVSERRHAEEERQKLEEQLRTAQKMEAIGILAGGIAHDFNNLLSVILSYTAFAMEEVREGESLRHDLAEVYKAGERATVLVRQLLAFGRKQVLEPQLLDLSLVVANLEKMLRRLIREDIEVVQVLAPSLGVVRADPGQIEQVIMNLVVNARDAMPEGGTLTIETSNAEIGAERAGHVAAVEPGRYVQIAVTDTGCGMNEQTKARIFDPFFTTKEKGKGTGLGLSTVYGIVKQSGGGIDVRSEPGEGTTFRVYLPRLAQERAAPVTSPTAERAPLGTETILLVEDEEAMRTVAARMLSAAGYRVLEAPSGPEALRVCDRHKGEIHLLLTDVVMPQMGGRQLAEQLHRMRPTMRVLYMSGYADDAITHEGVLNPATRFVGKPFSAADLARKVRDALDTRLAAAGSNAV